MEWVQERRDSTARDGLCAIFQARKQEGHVTPLLPPPTRRSQGAVHPGAIGWLLSRIGKAFRWRGKESHSTLG